MVANDRNTPRAPRGSQTFQGTPNARYALRLPLRAQRISDGVYQTWRPGTSHRTEFELPAGTVFTFIERRRAVGIDNRVHTRIELPDEERYGNDAGRKVDVWLHDNHADATSSYNEQRMRTQEHGRRPPNTGRVRAQVPVAGPEKSIEDQLADVEGATRALREKAAWEKQTRIEKAQQVLRDEGFDIPQPTK